MSTVFRQKPSGLLIADVHFQKRFRVSTRLNVELRDWDQDRQRVRKSHPNSYQFNTRLSDIRIAIGEAILQCKRSQTSLSRNTLIQIMDPLLREREATRKQQEQLQNTSADHAFEVYYQLKKNRGATTETLRHYRTVWTKLQQALRSRSTNETSASSQPIRWKDFSVDGEQRFISYLKDLGNSHNTISHNLRQIKTFLTYAAEMKYPLPEYARSKRAFRQAEKKVNKPALTTDELHALRQRPAYSPSMSERQISAYENARRHLLFLCHTAMRYQDFENLTPQNIYEHEEGWVLDYTQGKTGTRIIAPLHPIALEVYQQEENRRKPTKAFAAICRQEFSRRIKALAKDFLHFNRDHNGKPLYQQISSHIGRRTFITQWFEHGGSIEGCRIHSGHLDTNVLVHYHKQSLAHNIRAGSHALWSREKSI